MEEPEQARVNVRDRCCQSIRGADRGRGRIRPSVRPVCSGFVETCMDTVGGRMYACRSRRCSQPANPSKVRTSELGCVRGLQDRSESSRDETRRGETRRDETSPMRNASRMHARTHAASKQEPSSDPPRRRQHYVSTCVRVEGGRGERGSAPGMYVLGSADPSVLPPSNHQTCG